MSTDAQREIDRCTASIINSPNDPLLFHTRGYYYGQIGEHLKAVDDYTESIRLKPEDFAAFANRGLSYSNLGEYQKAILDYDGAIRLYPDPGPELYTARAIAHEALSMFEAAAEDRAMAAEITRLDELEELEDELDELEEPVEETEESNHYY